jgi:hypothetical protein
VNNLALEPKKGTISSIILSVVVLGILVLPFYITLKTQEAREGKGYFEPEQKITWDLEDEESLMLVEYDYPDTDPQGEDLPENWLFSPDDWDAEEPAAVFWWYWVDDLDGIDLFGHQLDYSFVNVSLDGTVDDYLLFITSVGTIESTPVPPERLDEPEEFEHIDIYLDIDSNDFLVEDVAKIEFYFDCEADVTLEYSVTFITGEGEHEIGDGDVNLGGLTVEGVDALDLLQIAGLTDEVEYLRITISMPEEEYFELGDVIVFDCQLGSLDSKVPTLTRIASWYFVLNGFMTFIAILMLESVSFMEHIVDPINNYFKSLGARGTK